MPGTATMIRLLTLLALLLFDAGKGGELHGVIGRIDGIQRVLILELGGHHFEEGIKIGGNLACGAGGV